MPDHATERRTILVVGACCLDRILTVDQFPSPDAKVRTTSHVEVGGGNAANTATALALLLRARVVEPLELRVKLLTKVGDDPVGEKLLTNLTAAGVDTSLVQQAEQSTSSLTTVIVSASEHTRTCLHTAGSCGELTAGDMERIITQHHIFDCNDADGSSDNGVVHVHSDGRHTAAALVLAREASRRGINVSLDVEKDRHLKALDQLLELAGLVFTNSCQMEGYLDRLTREWEALYERKFLPTRRVINAATNLKPEDAELYAKAVEPSAFCTRWFAQKGKQVIITQGQTGSVHIRCHDLEMYDRHNETTAMNEIVVVHNEIDAAVTAILHEARDETADRKTTRATYLVTLGGVIKNANVVDTTGAGDAFIAGYLLAKLLSFAASTGLRLGAWVSGRKLSGFGAQTTLPTAIEFNHTLGLTKHAVESELHNVIQPRHSIKPP